VTNGEMVFDSPMSLLAQISHNTNREFVVWYVNGFPIVSPDYGWRPPTNMLCSKENKDMLAITQGKKQIKK
jgi:hypothetical protein